MTNPNQSRQTIRKESLSPLNVQMRIQKAQAQTQTSQTPVNSPKTNTNQKK